MPTMIDRTCPVCKKGFQIAIKRINVGGGVYCSNICRGRAKYKGGKKATSKRMREKNHDKYIIYNLKYNQRYRKTIRGHLILLFHQIKNRCNNSKLRNYKWYGGRGIKCLFKSSQEFAGYVINELKINPCGLEIHRIDNNEHYEPGNIEFLTSGKHGLKHRKAG